MMLFSAACDWFACDWLLLLATGLLATGYCFLRLVFFRLVIVACDWLLLLATGLLATGYCSLRLIPFLSSTSLLVYIHSLVFLPPADFLTQRLAVLESTAGESAPEQAGGGV
ncbi:hypothetical protein F511_13237 [Dorcoceras hygrometricum]|uniref:Uncharacterized protein n=1 Tax=Dorcoceras hygrometricum TaxID=472368 RepID=A0A2Z7D2M2_9LAMI|nr:hypothetical protein F511_13237 [Dorcoceras hygrometricum]